MRIQVGICAREKNQRQDLDLNLDLDYL